MSSKNFKSEIKTAMEICDKIKDEGLKLWTKNLLYWYIRHAKLNKRLWYLRNFIGIAFPAVVSLCQGLGCMDVIENISGIIMSVAGAVVTIAIAFLTFLNPEKKHLLYRQAAEDIKRILFVNLKETTEIKDYEKIKKEIEECLLNEQAGWYKVHKDSENAERDSRKNN